jgi:replicative DNA helicase
VKLPYHEEAERAVAGAVVVRGEAAIVELVDRLKGDDFYTTASRAVFESALTLWERREPIDVVSLEAELRSREQLRLVGGIAGLSSLGDSGTLAALAHHAQRVRELGQVRRLAMTCLGIAEEAASAIATPSAWLNGAEARLFAAARQGDAATAYNSAALMRLAWDDIKARIAGVRPRCVSSGFPEVDKLLGGGLNPGDFVVIGGRPGMGKTALALNLLARAAIVRPADWLRPVGERPRMNPVLMFSVEMAAMSLAQRLLAFEAQLPFEVLRTGIPTDVEVVQLLNATARVELADMIIDDDGGLSLLDMRARARRWRADRRRFPQDEPPVGLILVDYLQLVEATASIEVREQQISEISRACKALAKELKLPVVGLSQLNRGVDSRDDHRPNLSDLRESGAIEQDADAVIFPFREVQYLAANAPLHERARLEHKAEIIVRKARNGQLGVVDVAWIGRTQTFAERTFDHVQ